MPYPHAEQRYSSRLAGALLPPMGADEIVASRRGERVADTRAIAHLPIMTDKESAGGPSLFACGSSHHSGNVVQPAVPRSRLAHERRRVAFFATAWFGQDPAGPGRVAVAPLVFAALGPQLGPPIQLVGRRPLAQALNATGLSVGSRGAGRASFPLRSSGPRCGANCRPRRRRAAPLINKGSARQALRARPRRRRMPLHQMPTLGKLRDSLARTGARSQCRARAHQPCPRRASARMAAIS